MPKKRGKKDKIVVSAPYLTSKKEILLRDTIGAEEFVVSKASKRVGRLLSGVMMIIGTLLSLLSLISVLTFMRFSVSNPLFINALGFLGVINILCGLVLLTKR